jgi:glycosyltransferase involved in cell wall biosynthesis
VESVTFLTEPLLSEEFVQYRFTVPLAAYLSQSFHVAVASPAIAPDVQASLRALGIEPISGGAWFPPLRHSRDEIPSYVWSWSRDAALRLNGRRLQRLLEGPLGPTLRTIGPSLRPTLRWGVRVLGPGAAFLDEFHLRAAASRTRAIYTHSASLQAWFREHRFPVEGVVPGYLYPFNFAPTTATPTREYILAYLGKETHLRCLRELARSGLPIKVFGMKSRGWISGSRIEAERSNIELLGAVSHDELRTLYTNALFTAFPFTEEPFGLIPIESMACGTPVLTYSKQGPGETVLDGATGWLVSSSEEFVRTAERVHASGYPNSWREACMRQANTFRIEVAANRWSTILRNMLDRESEPPSRSLFPGRPMSSNARHPALDGAH